MSIPTRRNGAPNGMPTGYYRWRGQPWPAAPADGAPPPVHWEHLKGGLAACTGKPPRGTLTEDRGQVTCPGCLKIRERRIGKHAPRTHWQPPGARITACGTDGRFTTADHDKVTCGICKRTGAWLDAAPVPAGAS